jgi:hypothetical protein
MSCACLTYTHARSCFCSVPAAHCALFGSRAPQQTLDHQPGSTGSSGVAWRGARQRCGRCGGPFELMFCTGGHLRHLECGLSTQKPPLVMACPSQDTLKGHAHNACGAESSRSHAISSQRSLRPCVVTHRPSPACAVTCLSFVQFRQGRSVYKSAVLNNHDNANTGDGAMEFTFFAFTHSGVSLVSLVRKTKKATQCECETDKAKLA